MGKCAARLHLKRKGPPDRSGGPISGAIQLWRLELGVNLELEDEAVGGVAVHAHEGQAVSANSRDWCQAIGDWQTSGEIEAVADRIVEVGLELQS